MTITIAAFEGSETVSTVEHSMTTDTAGPDATTTDGIFQAFIDLSALAAADIFTFAAYETVATTAGTQRKVYTATFSNAQATPIWVSPTLILGVGWDMTLIKNAGTDRLIVWRIASVA
jgi:hypothetical protein